MYTPWNWVKDTGPSNQTEGQAMLDLLAAVQEANGDDGESIWKDPESSKTEKPIAGVSVSIASQKLTFSARALERSFSKSRA